MYRMHLSRFLTALVLLCAWQPGPPLSVAAQTSRSELIAEEQKAKAAHLASEGPSRLENIVGWVQRLPIISPTSGLYPWAGSIYPGTGLGLGAGYVKLWSHEARLSLLAGAEFQGSNFFDANARVPETAGSRLTVTVDARYLIAKDLSFFGLGANSSRADPLHYDYKPTTAGVTAAFHPVRWVEISGRYERMTLETEGSAPSAPAEAPGLGDDLTYNVVQAAAAIDWRPSPDYSTRGGFHRLTWSRYLETQDRPFEFQKLEYEGIQLVPILREQWVLAGRVLTTLTTTEHGDAVPMVLAPTLGDAETLRGFHERRFTDLNRLCLTGEYRWRPSRYLDMAVFFDTGKVGTRRKDLGLSNLETDWGLGARFHGPKFVFFRTEIAKSREGWEIITAGGKAF